jgi:16S rRNA A1518/A1519 N6-dimethyltransferase RsmA/KsgA/DIM1 with predicted DNA glycosylase/AP lyase activity
MQFSLRKRAVKIHVSDSHGDRLQGAYITIEQISKDFPFGSAIASTILGNLPYQVSSILILVLQKIGNRINGKECYFLIRRLTKKKLF